MKEIIFLHTEIKETQRFHIHNRYEHQSMHHIHSIVKAYKYK